jgi:uncharacterized protein (TIGR03435 family)
MGTDRVAHKLDLRRKLLLGAAGWIALAIGLAYAVQSRAQSAAQNTVQSIEGTWQGTLYAVQGPIRNVLKISKADGGGWKAVLYSIDQGGRPIPADTVTLQGSTLKISVSAIGDSYEGKLSADGQSISGTWTQGPLLLPLNLERATEQTAWEIPAPIPPPKPMAADADPSFEVATIKPSTPGAPGNGFRVQGRQFSTLYTSLDRLITYAYGIQTKQIIGAPAWAESDRYDLLAEPDGEGQPNDNQWKVMLQKLLADRFKLAFHRDKKEFSVYALVVGKDGPKLTKSDGDPNGIPGLFFKGFGAMTVMNATMADFAGSMQRTVLDRPVVDQTGLKMRFNFVLKWTPDESQFGSIGIRVPPSTDNPDAPPDLFTAMQEQLGLKLESTKAPVDVLVIDHVEKPSAN